MKTIEYLSGPDSALFWPAVMAGLAIALQGALLSVPVVLRRLAFIGQGVSHAAFGGVGLATILGLMSPLAGAGEQFLAITLIGAFCIGTALGIAYLSDRTGAREDTIIGIFLVGSMALGALLLHLHRRGGGGSAAPPAEEILFGSILAVRSADAWAGVTIALLIGAVLWWFRRGMLFWAFDEQAAEAFGVPTGPLRVLLLALLGVSIVASMKLAGVVLATALLVLPAATALRLSKRLWTVFALSAFVSLGGMVGGLVLSFEADWPPGPAVVAVLVGMFGVAWVLGGAASLRAAPKPAPA